MHRLRSTSFAALTLVSAVAALPARAAPTLLLLHTFEGTPDGSNPTGPPTAGPNGVVYGTTYGGGTTESGTVYELTPPSGGQTAWTETILSNLGAGDGIGPDNNLIVGKNGVLYGSAGSGGQYSNGTVFQLTPPASTGSAWKFTRLHSFNKTTDGKVPGNLVAINNNSLFGPTYEDGHVFPNGTVFELSPPPLKTGAAVETTIAPVGGTQVISNGAGGLYVLGYQGFYIYDLTPPTKPGGSWSQQTIFFSATSSIGCPVIRIASDTKGHLYGTVDSCGPNGSPFTDYIVQLVPPATGSASWSENVIYQPSTDPAIFVEDLTVNSLGVLYSCQGEPSGDVVVFTLTPPVSPSSSWTEATYFTFPQTGYPVASAPSTGISLDSSGNIYFTSDGSGIDYSVWKISK